MDLKDIVYEYRENVAWIIINRPKQYYKYIEGVMLCLGKGRAIFSRLSWRCSCHGHNLACSAIR